MTTTGPTKTDMLGRGTEIICPGAASAVRKATASSHVKSVVRQSNHLHYTCLQVKAQTRTARVADLEDCSTVGSTPL